MGRTGTTHSVVLGQKDARTWTLGLQLAGTIALAASPAMAQDTSLAEGLFNQGIAEMTAGDYGGGCPALERSYQLDPKAGVLFALADCLSLWGKVASATANYQRYIDLVSKLPTQQRERHAERKQRAIASIERLGPSIPELAIELTNDAPSNTEIRRDGVPIERSAIGLGQLVDPGEHTITTRVPGGPETTTRLILAPGDKIRVRLPAKVPDSPERTALAPASPRRFPATPWILGGIGCVGVITGAVTGLMALDKKATVRDNCDGPACNGTGKTAVDEGKNLARVSDASFAIGLLGIGSAIALWATQNKSDEGQSQTGWRPVFEASPSAAWAGARTAW
jgi:hypothetical protein